MASTHNLKSLRDRSPEERKKIASMGGKKSQAKKREKKLLSEIYSEILAEEYGVDKDALDLKSVIKDIIKFRAPHSVSLLKEVREATEGNKTTLVGDASLPIQINIIPVSAKNE